MRITKGKLATVSAVTFVLIASSLWVSRDSLRVQYHLRALHRAEQQMFAPQPSTFGLQAIAFLLRRPSSEGWAKICTRHEDALLRIGYFARREFPLTNQHINAVQLITNAQQRFGTQFSSVMVVTNGQRLGSTTVASNSFAAVIAPTAEMSNWNKLIFELDGGRL